MKKEKQVNTNPVANQKHIKALQDFVQQNSNKVDDVYYSVVLSHFDEILVQNSLRNVYIDAFNKNIILNIVFNDIILKKIKFTTKCSETSWHFDFLEKLFFLIIKSYFININNYNYKSMAIRIIYLVFLNKEKDLKTPLVNKEIIKLLLQKHDILTNIVTSNVKDTYKDISSMCISMIKHHNTLIPIPFTVQEILSSKSFDAETKIKYLSCLDIDPSFKKEKELEYVDKILYWVKADETKDSINGVLNAANNNLSLLNQFITDYDDESLWNLMVNCVNKIVPYISGDPSADLNNEYRITISFKIYKNIIEIIMNKKDLYLKIDFITELLLQLTNSACIHITIPVYKDLLKNSLTTVEKQYKILESLDNIKYNHFGRRFGALPYMYQNLYEIVNKSKKVVYKNNSLTAISFELKLAVLPYLNITEELTVIFNYTGKEDYIIDTYIVRFITGLVAFIVTKMKKSNYKAYKEAVNMLVSWINNNGVKKEKLLLSVLTQMVMYGSYLNKMDINWNRIANHKNHLIRKAGAELFYVCNFRGFSLLNYIKSIDLTATTNEINYQIFILNEHTKKNTFIDNDISILLEFFSKILFENECFYLHLQVFKNINESNFLLKHSSILELSKSYYDDVLCKKSVANGINELLVAALIKIINVDIIEKLLETEYYEIVLDYLLQKKNTRIEKFINILIDLYKKEKFSFIKLKIIKILQRTTLFDNYDALIEKSTNHNLSLEFEIFNIDSYWTYFSGEDETLRLIALKKAIFSKNLLKQYQFENDDNKAIISLFESLNLKRLNDNVSNISLSDIALELKELVNVIIKEIKNEKTELEMSEKLFDEDNFHNSSNLWWYVYILTKYANISSIGPIQALNIFENIGDTFDIRMMMLYRITGAKDLNGIYAKCAKYL
ncbi:hypothetical protein QEN19_003723 [Hanseniaspora menglaensis]